MFPFGSQSYSPYNSINTKRVTCIFAGVPVPGTDDGSGVIVEHSSNTRIRKHKTTNTTRYLVPRCTPPSSRSDDFNGGKEASKH